MSPSRTGFLLPFFIICTLVSIAFSQTEPPVKAGSVTGRFVVQDGGTMSGGQVLFYNADDGPPPLFAKYTRVPDSIAEIDAGNRFTTTLPVGRYYFLAAKRLSGETLGPPREGDYGFRYMDKKKNVWKEFTLREGADLDLGTFEVTFRGKREKKTDGITVIQGILRDTDGNRIENGVVFAFPTPQMVGKRPGYVSNETGKDGKYSLYVAGDETYYLMARDTLGGGQLSEGSIIGIYGDDEPIGVTIQTGQTVKRVDINVTRLDHRGPDLIPGEEKTIDLNNIGKKKPSALPPNKPVPPSQESKQPGRE